MEIYILIFLIAICAFIPRYLPWVIFSEKNFSKKLENIFKMVPPAIISAIVFPSVFYIDGVPDINFLIHPYFIASIATFIFTLITKRIIISSSLGVIVFLLLKFILEV